MLYKTMLPASCKAYLGAVFATELELWWLGLGFYMRLAGSGSRRAALNGMPPAAGDGRII